MQHRFVLAIVFLSAACVDPESDRSPLVPTGDLGAADPDGVPYDGDWKADAPLPARVDHAAQLPPARSQGSRGTCASFTFTEATEGFWGLTEPLSVEHFMHENPIANIGPYTLRLPGTKLVREVAWPYQADPDAPSPPPANLESLPTWAIPRVISTGLREKTLETYLAESPRNNIAIAIMWDDDLAAGNELPDPQMTLAQSLAARAECNFHASCGGHMVLVVGYEQRRDSDGAMHTFFKFKNSWGTRWGDHGYGYISAKYLAQMGIAGYLIKS